jgi:hypothetical protein
VKRGTEHVVVGDFAEHDNESIQVRNMTSEAIGDPSQTFVLFAVEPVSSPSFFPAKINPATDTPRNRQSLAVVGYGCNRAWNESIDVKSFPREAMEKSVQATGNERCLRAFSNDFCAADFGGGGPCEGTSCIDFPLPRETLHLPTELTLVQAISVRLYWTAP